MLSPDETKFVEDCLNSGKTQTSYCDSQGVPMSKFYYLLKKYRKLGRQVEGGDGGGFVKLQFEGGGTLVRSVPLMELIFPCGARLVFHAPASAAFIKSLL